MSNNVHADKYAYAGNIGDGISNWEGIYDDPNAVDHPTKMTPAYLPPIESYVLNNGSPTKTTTSLGYTFGDWDEHTILDSSIYGTN